MAPHVSPNEAVTATLHLRPCRVNRYYSEPGSANADNEQEGKGMKIDNMKKAKVLFDFQCAGWRLVTLDFCIGIPASALLSFVVKLLLRVMFATCVYYGFVSSALRVGSVSDATLSNHTCSMNATCIANSTALNGALSNGTSGLINSGNIATTEEAWKSFESLTCGLVFAIANSVLVLVWALQIEERGVETIERENRLRQMALETEEWEDEVRRLENVLAALKTERTLTTKLDRYRSRVGFGSEVLGDTTTGINQGLTTTPRLSKSGLYVRGMEEKAWSFEEQRRRSGSVEPETPVDGSW